MQLQTVSPDGLRHKVRQARTLARRGLNERHVLEALCGNVDAAWSCIGLGIGLGLFSGGGLSPGAMTPMDVYGASNVTQWVNAARGVTLSTTPAASGTTPPAVTWSGSGLTTQNQYQIVIDGAGASGAATFKWFSNGTLQASGVLTGGAVALGTTNVTVNFVAGAYLVGQTYDSTIATWADQQTGNTANNYTDNTAAAANRAKYLWQDATLNNVPTIQIQSTTTELDSGLRIVAPGTTPTTIVGVLRVDSYTAASRYILLDVVSAVLACAVYTINATNNLDSSCGTAKVGPLPVSTWKRFRAQFSNQATDIFRVGSGSAVLNAGNNANAAANRCIGLKSGSQTSLHSWGEFYYMNRLETSTEIAIADLRHVAIFGSSVTA